MAAGRRSSTSTSTTATAPRRSSTTAPTCSTSRSLPTRPYFYPWFWGYAHERGVGTGEGWTVNLPLPPGTDDAGFLDALDRALAAIADVAPDMLVVALGLDTHVDDP